MTDPPRANTGTEVTRRDFFNEVAAGALGIAGFGALVVSYRYLSPNKLETIKQEQVLKV